MRDNIRPRVRRRRYAPWGLALGWIWECQCTGGTEHMGPTHKAALTQALSHARWSAGHAMANGRQPR